MQHLNSPTTQNVYVSWTLGTFRTDNHASDDCYVNGFSAECMQKNSKRFHQQKALRMTFGSVEPLNACRTRQRQKVVSARHYPVGVVALFVVCRTCDQEVVGSSLGQARGIKTLGMFLTPMCLCSPSSTSWYRPKDGDALRLGSKGRYGSCVGGR